MSQFSRKYYNLDYKRNVKKEELPDTTVWEFWRVWGIFEHAVIALLLMILFCLCTLHQSQPRTLTRTVVEKVIQQPQNPKPKEEPSKPKHKPLSLGDEYPKKILPASVLPPHTENSKQLYGPLSIENYLYFVDATESHFPDFIDSSSRRIVKSKAPKCSQPQCPLQSGVTKEDMEAYVQWVQEQSQKKLQLLKKDGMYYLQQEK